MSDVGIVKPFYIGGIDGGSRGLCIGEDGDFNDLGHGGLAMILKTRLIDADFAVLYDADADVYYIERIGAILSVAR